MADQGPAGQLIVKPAAGNRSRGFHQIMIEGAKHLLPNALRITLTDERELGDPPGDHVAERIGAVGQSKHAQDVLVGRRHDIDVLRLEDVALKQAVDRHEILLSAGLAAPLEMARANLRPGSARSIAQLDTWRLNDRFGIS
jgi:hypothetical protein